MILDIIINISNIFEDVAKVTTNLLSYEKKLRKKNFAKSKERSYFCSLFNFSN